MCNPEQGFKLFFFTNLKNKQNEKLKVYNQR